VLPSDHLNRQSTFFASRRRPGTPMPPSGNASLTARSRRRGVSRSIRGRSLATSFAERRSSSFRSDGICPVPKDGQQAARSVPLVGTPSADPDLGSARPLTAGLCGPRSNPSVMGAFSWDVRPPIRRGSTVTQSPIRPGFWPFARISLGLPKRTKDLARQGLAGCWSRQKIAQLRDKTINNLFCPSRVSSAAV